jgi:hypothetical protein
MITIVLLSLFCFVLFVLLCFSAYYNYKFGRIIVRMEDALEVSLDRLDSSYASINEVLQIPLFYDSPQVRQVIQDLKNSREAILYVANQIGKIEEFGEEDGEIQEGED